MQPGGIQVLVVEPGAFRTGFSGKGLLQSHRIDAYDGTVGATRDMITGIDGTQPGDPARAAAAILEALAATPTPLRLPLGSDSVDGILDHLASVEKEIRSWEPTSRGTDFAWSTATLTRPGTGTIS